MYNIYSCICVLPDEFLLKSDVFTFISKEISPAEHEYLNIPPPPPPINALATALRMCTIYLELLVLVVRYVEKQLKCSIVHVSLNHGT